MKDFRAKIVLVAVLIMASLTVCYAQSFSQIASKIQLKFSDCEIYLNETKIDLDTLYLDTDNIKNVKINRAEKRIYITQKKKDVDFFSPHNSFPDFQKILVNNQLIDTLRLRSVEIGAVENIEIHVREEDKLLNHRKSGTGFLLINLKK